MIPVNNSETDAEESHQLDFNDKSVVTYNYLQTLS